MAEFRIGQAALAHETRKDTGLEDSSHKATISLGDIASQPDPEVVVVPSM
jgi:hypothetical protein